MSRPDQQNLVRVRRVRRFPRKKRTRKRTKGRGRRRMRSLGWKRRSKNGKKNAKRRKNIMTNSFQRRRLDKKRIHHNVVWVVTNAPRQ